MDQETANPTPTRLNRRQIWADRLSEFSPRIQCAMEIIYWSVVALLSWQFLLYLKAAVEDIAMLFGWLIGASKSPITAAVTPLIFGLLGAVVLATIKQLHTSVECFAMMRSFKSSATLKDDDIKSLIRESQAAILVKLVAAILVLWCAIEFVGECRYGISQGQAIAEQPLQPSPAAP